MRSFSSDPVEVRLESCFCPNAPHDSDVVYLAPSLSMAGGMAAQVAVTAGMTDQIALQELLAQVWVRHGVVGWNLVDDDGEPLPLTPDNITKALPYGKGGRQVAERADDLYAQDVLRPLQERLKKLSKPGPTQRSPSTSRTRTRTPKQPSPSSTATTAKEPAAA